MTVRDVIALSLCGGLRSRAATLRAVCHQHPDVPPEMALEVMRPGQPPVPLHELHAAADAALEAAARADIVPLTVLDHDYPEALAAIPDPPLVLWVRGSRRPLSGRLVAIVGSRAASVYGLEVAERLAYGLARAGVTVVSGLARGCDGAAHRGALAGGGPTVAVVGCGPDITYPAEHRELQRAVAAGGAVVGEWPAGTPPLPAHFPLRNRLISGLSRAVVIVEASESSGSLITAQCALEQGREVMAVPGGVLGGRHRGCHGLLRDGARLVQSAEDVLDELGWCRDPVGPIGTAEPPALVAWAAPGDPFDADEVGARTGLPPAEVLRTLSQLELSGEVRRVAGGRFVRTGRQ